MRSKRHLQSSNLYASAIYNDVFSVGGSEMTCIIFVLCLFNMKTEVIYALKLEKTYLYLLK